MLQSVTAMWLHLLTLFATIESARPAGGITPEPGVYNSSITPAGLPWNIYNYCNAPHVNKAHYTKPTNVSGSKLVYMNVMIRHHKVRL